MNIFDVITAKEIATYWTEKGSEKLEFLGDALFPAKKQAGLDLSWIKGYSGLPVMLKPSSFDADVPFRDRIGFGKISTEMPFFREGFLIKEKDRQELIKLMASGNQNLIDMYVQHIFDDAGTLLKSAQVARERMRMQLLGSGTVLITANNEKLDYDYQLPDNRKKTLTGTNKWSDLDDSDPIKDIREAQELVEGETGVKPTRAVCTSKTFSYLLKNEKIKTDLNMKKEYVKESTVREYISDMLDGFKIATYNKMYNDGSSSTKYFPDDVFTLLPEGNLGNTYFGTTPEEADLLGKTTNNLDVSVVDTGVAVTTERVMSVPTNVKTIVSQVTLPSFEAIDNIYILTVHTA